jgi:hypothetical protein
MSLTTDKTISATVSTTIIAANAWNAQRGAIVQEPTSLKYWALTDLTDTSGPYIAYSSDGISWTREVIAGAGYLASNLTSILSQAIYLDEDENLLVCFESWVLKAVTVSVFKRSVADGTWSVATTGFSSGNWPGGFCQDSKRNIHHVCTQRTFEGAYPWIIANLIYTKYSDGTLATPRLISNYTYSFPASLETCKYNYSYPYDGYTFIVEHAGKILVFWQHVYYVHGTTTFYYTPRYAEVPTSGFIASPTSILPQSTTLWIPIEPRSNGNLYFLVFSDSARTAKKLHRNGIDITPSLDADHWGNWMDVKQYEIAQNDDIVVHGNDLRLLGGIAAFQLRKDGEWLATQVTSPRKYYPVGCLTYMPRKFR